MNFKTFVKKSFNAFGVELINRQALRRTTLERREFKIILDRITSLIEQLREEGDNAEVLNFLKYAGDKLVKVKSQLFQELFVLYCLKDKKGGFYVEFGASDGRGFSNTFLLEKEYSWKGILAEPARVWTKELKSNRSCAVDTRCVWTETGKEINFYETDIAELSTIESFADQDFFSSDRKNKKAYKVQTISLMDLLEFHNAPANIDYLSLDTEGSEFEILNSFDFSRYNIKIITVEHNFSPNRELIFDLLTSKNFQRVFETISDFDDWYVKK